jgi:hypothetical protein
MEKKREGSNAEGLDWDIDHDFVKLQGQQHQQLRSLVVLDVACNREWTFALLQSWADVLTSMFKQQQQQRQRQQQQ